jgi:inner membrane protein import complex subunit Tim44-like protein
MAYPPGGLGPVERAEEHLFHFRKIASDEEKLIDLEQQEVDGTVAGLKDRTPAELHGVDTSTIKQIDPEFDAEAFRAIARETFYKVRDARKLQNPQESAELLSPQMQREIQDAISGDVAAHQHHLLPFLWINDATIAGAEVVDGQGEIDVRFSISAAEEDLDDRTGQVLAGGGTEHSWEELWRFTRGPKADTSVSDERHEITNVAGDQWMVAHRGWIVTDIARLPAS